MDGVEGFRLLLTISLSGEADSDPVEDENREEENFDGVVGQECSQCRFEDERKERQRRWMPPASNLSKYLLQSSNSITNCQLDLCPPPPAPTCSRLCPRHCPPPSRVPQPTFKSVREPDYSPPHQSFQRSLPHPHPRRPQQSERIQPTFEPKRRAKF